MANAQLRSDLKNCKKKIISMIKTNNEENYMPNDNILEYLLDIVGDAIEGTADMRDILKIQRIKSYDLTIETLIKSENQAHPHNSKLDVTNETTMEDLDRQIQDKVLSELKKTKWK